MQNGQVCYLPPTCLALDTVEVPRDGWQSKRAQARREFCATLARLEDIWR